MPMVNIKYEGVGDEPQKETKKFNLMIITYSLISNTVIAIGKFKPLVKYYINRVNLSQDYIP